MTERRSEGFETFSADFEKFKQLDLNILATSNQNKGRLSGICLQNSLWK